MFKTTSATNPEEYIALVAPPRKTQIQFLHELIKKTTPKLSPHIQAGMIGYGPYHYTYASGRSGDWPIVALANQKNYISLYICCTDNGVYLAEKYKDRLGKVSVGKSCIRFKNIDDLNLAGVKKMLLEAQKIYPTLKTTTHS